MTKKYPYHIENLHEWNEKIGKVRAFFVSNFLPKYTKKLLDIGGFYGDLKKFINEDIEYHLIDMFAPNEKNFLNFDLNRIKNEKLPYDDNYFDVVVAFDIFEHIKYPIELLEEIERVLKKEGLFITSKHKIDTGGHYFSLQDGFFENWEIKMIIPVVEAYYPNNQTVGCILFSVFPTEIFLLLNRDKKLIIFPWKCHCGKNSIGSFGLEGKYVNLCHYCSEKFKEDNKIDFNIQVPSLFDINILDKHNKENMEKAIMKFNMEKWKEISNG